MAADWSLLPDDILEMIGKKLYSPKDIVSSGLVYKSWRATNVLKSPWLILFHSEQKERRRRIYIRGLVSLGDKKLYKHPLPDLEKFGCLGSTSDCLILHEKKIIRLFNPFRGFTHTNLPPLEISYSWSIPLRFTLQFSAASSLFVFFCDYISKDQRQSAMVFARQGDLCWTKAKAPSHGPVCDIIFYGEKIYDVNHTGQVTEWVFSEKENSRQLIFSTTLTVPIVPSESSETLQQGSKLYLAEWKGELLVVHKTPRSTDTKKRFKVYKVDLNTYASRPRELKSLGTHSLFLGLNNSVSVFATDYSGCVKPNCIYFTEDHLRSPVNTQRGCDMGVFDMETGRLQSHYINDLINHKSLPLWIVPTPPVEKESRKRKAPDSLNDTMSNPKRTNSLKELLY